jgi:TonB-dependent receptor
MAIGSKSFGYWRAMLLASSPLLALAPNMSVQAQQASATVPASTAGTPAAKQTNGDQLDEVIVTGYAASLQTALDNKRKSVLPIESVAPEDIGKMPDQDVAEALQRLPGVQIDRDAQGLGTAVLIDGLRNNLTTLNGDIFLTGREFYVSGEASGGGSGANAQYDSLEGIPSEEIGGIDVYKNPEASITEGGLGGTINLKSRDPLAGPDGLSLGGNFRESEGRDTGSWTPLGTLVGSYKFSDNFALTGSVSYDDEKTQTNEFEDENRNQWLITNAATGPYTGALTPAGITTLPQEYIEPQLGYLSNIQDQRKTLGATLGAFMKFGDSVTSRVVWFGSRETETTINYSDKIWFNGQGAAAGSATTPNTPLPGIDPTMPYSIDGNGVVHNATFNANGAETATLFQGSTDSANNFQWFTKFDNGGPWKGDVDLAFARATSNLQAAQADVEHGLYTTGAGVATSPGAPGCNNGGSTCTNATGSHGYEFSYANGGTSGLPSVSYLSPYGDILNNPAWTTFKSNWAWANYSQEREWSIKGDLSYDTTPGFGIDSLFSSGLRYASREVDQTFGRYLINGTLSDGEVAGTNTGTPAAGDGPWLYYQDPGYGNPGIPYSTGTTNPGLVSSVNIDGVGGSVIVKNPYTSGLNNPSTYLNSVWGDAGVINNTERFFKDGLSSFKVQEGTTALYLMEDLGNLDTNHFHLNVGLRVVDTSLTIDHGQQAPTPTYYGTASWNGVESNVQEVQTSRSYIDVLPSFNFVLEVSPTQLIRIGAARVTAPQNLFDLGLGNTYNFTRGNTPCGLSACFQFGGGTSGNPNLDPFRATQYDLSWENYFARGGLISVGTFYKQVDSFVETQNIATTVNDDYGGTTADVTEPVNAGTGKIYGVELGAQYTFGPDFMAWLRGFGFAANYTMSASSSNQLTSFATSTEIPGVARNSFTTTLFYARSGFSARASYSYRGVAINDSLVGATFEFKDQVGVEKTYSVYEAPYGQLDGQIGYDIGSHFGLVASAQNITNQAQHTYLQWADQPFTYDNSGRRYFAGFKFKL